MAAVRIEGAQRKGRRGSWALKGRFRRGRVKKVVGELRDGPFAGRKYR